MKKLLRRMLCMCEPSYILIKYSLILSCVLAICALAILVQISPYSVATYPLYRLAMKMTEIPAAILLVAAVGSVVFESQLTR